jgi:hypothetical protein
MPICGYKANKSNFSDKLRYNKMIQINIKSIYKYIFISLFAGSTANFIFAQGEVAPKYSNEFLQIGVGADALAKGNAMVAQTSDVNAVYWNPAGLVNCDKWLEVSLMHSEYFAGIAKYDYLGLAHKIDSVSTAAFSFIRFGVDDIPNTTQLIDNGGKIDYDRISSFAAGDYAFTFSYARKLSIPGLSIGGNFKIIYRKVGDFAKSYGFGLDAGAQYRLKKRWAFGATMRDVTSTFNSWIFDLSSDTKEVFLKTGNKLPQNGLELTLPRLILGAQGKFDLGKKGIWTAAEIDLDMTTDGRRNVLIPGKPFSFDPHLGLEFGFKTVAYLRAGITNIQRVKQTDDKKKLSLQPNIGIGIAIKNVKIDYAFTDIGDQSVALYSNVISIKVKLNKPSPPKKS